MALVSQSTLDKTVANKLEGGAWKEAALRVFKIEAEAIEAMGQRLDTVFGEVVERIAKSQGKVVILGIGKSGLVGQKIAATLCSTGTPAVFLHAAEALHGDLGIYCPGDPTILISKSGSTAELVRLIPTLREFESPLIGILGNGASPIGRSMDYVLDASVSMEADPLGIVPTTSALVAMAMGDALAAALMQARGFKEQDFARYHPAGQLGRNLSLKVQDVMHAMDRVAVVALDTPLRHIVIALSEYPLGAACVLDKVGALLGLITDGDIRRALTNHEDIRPLKAVDIMTPTPIHTFPEVSLGEALKQMEDRPSQIAVLPVVEAGGVKCLGLLRIHDAYQPHLL